MAFLQMRSHRQRVGANQLVAASFLRSKASALSSKELLSLANALAENPFGKVITMIEDLLAKLKEEASMEQDHKSWCDEQLKSNKLKRVAKTSEVDKLNAEIDSTAAEISDMGKKIAMLSQEQSTLTKLMAESTAQRTAENAENTATIADAKAGSKAVAQAMEILKAFYESQGAGFAQVGVAQVPEMAEYKGLHAENKGVVGALEVIQTDFVRLEAETTAAERQASEAYNQFMEESKASKLQKHNMEVKT